MVLRVLKVKEDRFDVLDARVLTRTVDCPVAVVPLLVLVVVGARKLVSSSPESSVVEGGLTSELANEKPMLMIEPRSCRFSFGIYVGSGVTTAMVLVVADQLRASPLVVERFDPKM